MTKTLLAAVAALALSAGVVAAPAFAAAPNNTTAPAVKPAATTAAPAKAATPAKTKGPATTAPTTAAGKACSAQADAQNLHGKARDSFRSKCKAGMKASAAPKASTGDAKAPSTAPAAPKK